MSEPTPTPSAREIELEKQVETWKGDIAKETSTLVTS